MSQHQQRMEKLKQAVTSQIDSAQTIKGVLQVITGNGKGKSCAGFGTILRAIGHGKKVAVVQFLKGEWETGEEIFLKELKIPFYKMQTGFTWDSQNKEKDIINANEAFSYAIKLLNNESIDLLLLDELTYMISFHYLDLDFVVDAIKNRPYKQHVIITGRNCHKRLIEIADTVSDIKEIKHAFNAGIKAQAGFDY